MLKTGKTIKGMWIKSITQPCKKRSRALEDAPEKRKMEPNGEKDHNLGRKKGTVKKKITSNPEISQKGTENPQDKPKLHREKREGFLLKKYFKA